MCNLQFNFVDELAIAIKVSNSRCHHNFVDELTIAIISSSVRFPLPDYAPNT